MRRSGRTTSSRSCARLPVAERRIRNQHGQRNPMSKPLDDPLTIADKSFTSRLLIGSSGYPNQQVMLDSIVASGAQIVTLAIRRISLQGGAETVIDLLGGDYHVLPNTAGCYTARAADLQAQPARRALDTNGLKPKGTGRRDRHHPDLQ